MAVTTVVVLELKKPGKHRDSTQVFIQNPKLVFKVRRHFSVLKEQNLNI